MVWFGFLHLFQNCTYLSREVETGHTNTAAIRLGGTAQIRELSQPRVPPCGTKADLLPGSSAALGRDARWGWAWGVSTFPLRICTDQTL